MIRSSLVIIGVQIWRTGGVRVLCIHVYYICIHKIETLHNYSSLHKAPMHAFNTDLLCYARALIQDTESQPQS